MANTIEVRYIGEDYWGRKLYKNVENKRIYADVDGRLHTTTQEGEPDCPLRSDIEIVVISE
ncbi:hypothetical protein [Alicyclobacillus fodiniaquatilis]|uniref:YlzJ-like protein n=1 Tax=Alicyclobacillus fodiniaquatilis TaxID=1661150 RepID=A0ABW4JKU0_9BACL